LPKALSGGQRQRVAIGRAICRDPKVFLFDEPLSNLDAALRVATRIEIAKLKESMPGTTMVYVTHDQVEAMTLADRIVVLRAGVVEQVGAPMELYHKPANLFVAQFIGSPAMNVVPAKASVSGRTLTITPTGGSKQTLKLANGAECTKEAKFGIRPENFEMVTARQAIFSGKLSYVEQLGEVQILYVDIGSKDGPLIAKLPGSAELKRGQTIHLGATKDVVRVFDAEGKAVPIAA